MLAICTATLLADPIGATAVDVADAAEAAARVGFTEASVWAHHIPALAGSGLHIGAVEAATAWAGGPGERNRAEAEHLAALVEEHGATVLVAACMAPRLDEPGAARAGLAELAGVVGPTGARVCVEFLPWSPVPDLASAWSLVAPLDDSVALLLDTWHWQRQPGGPAPDLLAQIHVDRIGCVQVCDAGADPRSDDLMAEAMGERRLPGDGVVELGPVLEPLAQRGARPFVASEVFDRALLAEVGAEGAAARMAERGRSVLPEAWR